MLLSVCPKGFYRRKMFHSYAPMFHAISETFTVSTEFSRIFAKFPVALFRGFFERMVSPISVGCLGAQYSLP